MLDSEGIVAEGSGQNIFVVKDGSDPHAGRLRRHPQGRHPRHRHRARPRRRLRGAGDQLNRYDVYTADEAFFTGTASEVIAIRQVDGRVIGSGKPGPVTRDLRSRFQALVRS